MNHKWLFSLASALIVVGVIGAVFTFDSGQKAVAQEETFTEDDIDELDIRSSNVPIDVRATEENDISVDLDGTKSVRDDINLETEVDHQTLKVNLQDKSWHLFDLGPLRTSLELTIDVPEKQYQKMHVKNDNGRISVSGIEAEEVELATSNGIINGKDLTTSTISGKTNNGKVNLEYVEGDVKAEAENGKLDLTTSDLERSINMETVNGIITIHSDEEPENVTFATNVANGTVDIFGNDVGTIVGEGEHQVMLETVNGKIKVTH